jgi:hypothetical protein
MYPRVEGAPNRVLTVYPRAAAQKVFSSRHHSKTPTIHYRRRRRRRSNPLDGLVYIYTTRNDGGGRDFST